MSLNEQTYPEAPVLIIANEAGYRKGLKQVAKLRDASATKSAHLIEPADSSAS